MITQGQNTHWSTQVLYWDMQIFASCGFAEKSTFSQRPKGWLKYMSVSCWVSGFWSDLLFCVNIQIHYQPEMNSRSYLISLTILNIIRSLTIMPHPSPWILATDRSPVGNGNVSLIHLFTSESFPNNLQHIASHPETFLWKQARINIHWRLVFTPV